MGFKTSDLSHSGEQGFSLPPWKSYQWPDDSYEEDELRVNPLVGLAYQVVRLRVLDDRT